MRRLNEIVERKRKLFKKDHQKQLREIRIDYCESSQRRDELFLLSKQSGSFLVQKMPT